MEVCAYCCKPVETSEPEHVIPSSWYPKGTPDPSMPKVPSCRPCNGGFSKLEQRLLFAFGVCLDPKSPFTEGIAQTVLDSINRNSSPLPVLTPA